METQEIDWDKVYNYLEGTCHSVDEVIYFLSLECDEDEVVSKMVDRNLELCPNCDWWCESYELINTLKDEDEPDGYCENCR